MACSSSRFGVAGRFDHNIDWQVDHHGQFASRDQAPVFPRRSCLGGRAAQRDLIRIGTDRAPSLRRSLGADINRNTRSDKRSSTALAKKAAPKIAGAKQCRSEPCGPPRQSMCGNSLHSPEHPFGAQQVRKRAPRGPAVMLR